MNSAPTHNPTADRVPDQVNESGLREHPEHALEGFGPVDDGGTLVDRKPRVHACGERFENEPRSEVSAPPEPTLGHSDGVLGLPAKHEFGGGAQ